MAKGKGKFYAPIDEDDEEIITPENPKSNPKGEPEIKPKSESNPNHSTINNPKSNTNYEKVKYTDSRTQRAFYYDDNLIKIFDKHYPANKFNKSKIMNELLREFLVKNGKI